MNTNKLYQPDRVRSLGLCIGSLWLSLVGGGLTALYLYLIGYGLAMGLSAGMLLLALGMMVLSFRRLLTARKLPVIARPRRVFIHRVFLASVVAEIVAISVFNIWCVIQHHYYWIAPLDILVVGLHFFPLAKVFAVPRYHVLGAVFCLSVLVTVLFVPEGARIGAANAWLVVPGLISCISALVIAGAGLVEVNRELELLTR